MPRARQAKCDPEEVTRLKNRKSRKSPPTYAHNCKPPHGQRVGLDDARWSIEERGDENQIYWKRVKKSSPASKSTKAKTSPSKAGKKSPKASPSKQAAKTKKIAKAAAKSKEEKEPKKASPSKTAAKKKGKQSPKAGKVVCKQVCKKVSPSKQTKRKQPSKAKAEEEEATAVTQKTSPAKAKQQRKRKQPSKAKAEQAAVTQKASPSKAKQQRKRKQPSKAKAEQKASPAEIAAETQKPAIKSRQRKTTAAAGRKRKTPQEKKKKEADIFSFESGSESETSSGSESEGVSSGDESEISSGSESEGVSSEEEEDEQPLILEDEEEEQPLIRRQRLRQKKDQPSSGEEEAKVEAAPELPALTLLDAALEEDRRTVTSDVIEEEVTREIPETTNKVKLSRGKSGDVFCSESIQGQGPGRSANQDAASAGEVTMMIQNQEVPVLIYGVYDGHGQKDGGFFSKQVSRRLPQKIINRLEQVQNPESPEEVAGLVREAFIDLDYEIYHELVDPLKEAASGGSSKRKSKRSAVKTRFNLWTEISDKVTDGGTTAVVAVLVGIFLILAHLGDSRWMLVDGNTGQILRQSTDHTPDFDDEEKRAIEAGGVVSKVGSRHKRLWTQGNTLAVSRAFGDFEFKLKPVTEIQDLRYRSDGPVSAVPSVEIVNLNEANISERTHLVLVLATDGLVENMNPLTPQVDEQKFLTAFSSKQPDCDSLLRLFTSRPPIPNAPLFFRDDTTVMVVYLGNPEDRDTDELEVVIYVGPEEGVEFAEIEGGDETGSENESDDEVVEILEESETEPEDLSQ